MRVALLLLSVAACTADPDPAETGETGDSGTLPTPDLADAVAREACGAVLVLAEAGPLGMVLEWPLYTELVDAIVAGTPLAATGTIGEGGVALVVEDGGLVGTDPCASIEERLPTGQGAWWAGVAGDVSLTYTPDQARSAEDDAWQWDGTPLGEVTVDLDGVVAEPRSDGGDALAVEHLTLTARHATLSLPAR